MQQYRVNYPLLIGLIVGTLVCSGAVFAIWKFQIERKSGILISEAEKAREAGDVRKAAELYGQYLSIQWENDVRLKFAQASAELSKQDDVTLQEFSLAWQTLEQIVRDPELGSLPETNKLRRRLVEMYALMRRYPDALEHVDYLLEVDPSDAKLQTQKAAYQVAAGYHEKATESYHRLVGYDPASRTFDAAKATAPHDTQIYVDFARLVRARKNDRAFANKIMDQLVAANPESAEAYLARGQYLTTPDEPTAGKADIDKAYELKPEEADVIVAKALQDAQVVIEEAKAADKEPEAADFDPSLALLEKGKELDAENVRFYQAAAEIEIKRRDYEAALAQIDEGLKKIDSKKSAILLLSKADLQIQAEDLKGVDQTIEDMKRNGFRPEFTDYYLARKKLADKNWYQAANDLNRLRPRVADDPNSWPLNLVDIDFYLGLSYENQGKRDLARDQYQLVLDSDPENSAAIAGMQRVNAHLGSQSPDSLDPIQAELNAEMEKPVEQQNWARIEELLTELGKKNKLDEATVAVYRAQLMLQRKDFEGATKAIVEANKLSPKHLLIRRLAVHIARMNPKMGPERALEVWTKVAAEFPEPKNQPMLRLDKADILIAMKKDDLATQLASLTEGMNDWQPVQKAEFWVGMAQKYLGLGMMDEARQYLTLAADEQPTDLPIRVQLFQLALMANDVAAMKEAQDKIYDVVQDQNDSTWLYTEARRQLLLFQRGELGKEALDDIRLLVDRALTQRPEWHELYLIDAEIELSAGNPALALKAFDEAASRGLPNNYQLAAYVELLTRAGRFQDAAKQVDRIPDQLRLQLLGSLYTDILFRTGQAESAIRETQLATEAYPDNAAAHYLYSQLLARSAIDPAMAPERSKERLDKAIESLQKAVKLQPQAPDAWFFLINCYATQKDMESAQGALRDAQLALNGDNLDLFLAKSYAALGRWFDAETMYRSYYEGAPEGAPDKIGRTQMLADFYLSQVYQLPDREQKAAPLLNSILRAGADGKIKPGDANLLWARRKAAGILADTKDYQSLLKAEQLLSANTQGGQESVQDKLEMAQILKDRPEPSSRKRAIALLEEVAAIQPLNEASQLALADLYHKIGNWDKCYAEMNKAVQRFENSAVVREAFARKLLARNDQQSIDYAERQVVELRKLAPKSTASFELTVRLANKKGLQKQAREELLRTLAPIMAAEQLTDPQVRSLAMLASLLIELKDLENAQKIYEKLAQLNPSNAYSLAMFLGMHRGVDQCFAQLKQLYQAERVQDVLGVALAVVREKRDQVGEKFDPAIERWLDQALRENPESISLLLLKADYLDIRKEYDQAAAIYRKLLDRSDLTGMRRAVVLNNLSFLVALAGSSGSSDVDALKLVNEAAAILGPNSDILDTRAVVFTARKQYEEAIADLNDSVTDNPTPSKYFHLAEAHLGMNQNRDAVEAWKQAELLGLSRENINRMEHEKYDRLKSRIDQIRGKNQSVTQSAPQRRAG
jgi:tetratricopeptide (TPR) repeat protein